MSVEAITWALSQPINHSSAKFVLVVLANCASGDGNVAYPSSAYLSEATGQDRKTVLANLQRLRDGGYITDTGKRVGSTKQVVVYQLNTSENGTVKESQNRNGSESGTVPKTDGNSTVFPAEQYRFSAKQSQKRDTEPSEPSLNRKSNRQLDVCLPDWLPEDVWTEWVNHRIDIRKPLSQRAAELTIAKIVKLRLAGHDPKTLIENAIESGWQGIYAPRPEKPNANHQSSRKLSAVEQVEQAIREQFASEPDDDYVQPFAQIGYCRTVDADG